MANTKKNQKRLDKLYHTISDVLYRDAELDIGQEAIELSVHCFCYGIVKFLRGRDENELNKYRVCLMFKSSTSTNPYIYASIGKIRGKYRISVYRDNQFIKYMRPDIPSLVYNYNKELESYIKDFASSHHFLFNNNINDLMGCVFDVMISYAEDKAFNKTDWKVKEEGIFKIKTQQTVDTDNEIHYECFFTLDPDVPLYMDELV